jgi:pimeloyl-ACP methyl ester carboxylesterase
MLLWWRVLLVRYVAVVSVAFVAIVLWQWPPFDHLASAEAVDIVIDHDQTWHADEDYTISGSVSIENGATLTIEPGTIIIFSGNFDADGLQRFEVSDGSIEANGTEADPIIFKKQDEDTAFSLVFVSGPFSQESSLRYVRIEGGGKQARQIFQVFFDRFINTASAREYWYAQAAVLYLSGHVSIQESVFLNSGGADIFVLNPLDFGWDNECVPYAFGSSSFSVGQTDFKGPSNVPAVLSSIPECDLSGTFALQGNWYGAEEGPRRLDDDDWDAKQIISELSDEDFSPTELHEVCHSCASNVLFLPGIKASHLYKKDNQGNEDTLWLPSLWSNDLSELALNENGNSVHDVYTNDVLESYGAKKFYTSFVEDLEQKKDNHIINEYTSFAYDWRMSPKDVAYGDTPYLDGMRSLSDEVGSLAWSSKTGKVTIIAHSNGGLVAKELMSRLDELGMTGMVNRVVFVGTPQLGTPISILSLLYGYNESIPFLASRQDIRVLAENMPGAYGLLPSPEYFERSEDPLVSFSSGNTRFKSFRDAYGETIDDWDELADFLSGAKDGREKPAKNRYEYENVLRTNLLEQAKDMHQETDSWTPPSGVEAIQIAGWGLDTIRGIEYVEKQKASCDLPALVPVCTKVDDFTPIYEPKFTVDGDAVVTTPSALTLPSSANVKRYWVDLFESKRNHSNILEYDSLRTFLSQIVLRTENTSSLPKYISSSRPISHSKDKSRIRMALYSPLDVSITNTSGNRTGKTTVEQNGQTYESFEEGIPGSTYYQFADRKYVSFPEGTPVAIHLDGYDAGSYTLKFQEVAVTASSEEIVRQTTFEDLPVTIGTTVDLSVPKEGLAGLSTLRADMNGSEPGGEYSVAPVLDGTATLALPASVSVSTNDTGESGGGSSNKSHNDSGSSTPSSQPNSLRDIASNLSSQFLGTTRSLPEANDPDSENGTNLASWNGFFVMCLDLVWRCLRMVFSRLCFPVNMLFLWGMDWLPLGWLCEVAAPWIIPK